MKRKETAAGSENGDFLFPGGEAQSLAALRGRLDLFVLQAPTSGSAENKDRTPL